MQRAPDAAAEVAVTLRSRLWDTFVRSIGVNEQKKRAIRRCVDRPGRVLEIGCATGNTAGAFGPDYDYHGVDTDPQHIALARQKNRRPGASFHCLDLLEDPLPFDAGFDWLVISHTAHHLADDYLRRLLAKGADLLRPGGGLVILDMIRPAPDEPFNRQFYFRLDRGEHFRSLQEFEAVVAELPGFERAAFEVVPTTKVGIRVIDQILITARRGDG